MSDRDRLAELVKRAITDWEHGDLSESIANHLFANGVIVLPCEVGDVIYKIDFYQDCDIDGYGVCEEYEKHGDLACDLCVHDVEKYYVQELTFEMWMLDYFGKSVFLTREEAEAVLAKGKSLIGCRCQKHQRRDEDALD